MKRTISIVLALGLALVTTFAAVANTQLGTTLVSDEAVNVYGPLTTYAPPGDPAWGVVGKAKPTYVHPSWPWKTDTSGAMWISNSYLIGDPVAGSSWRWFSKGADLCDHLPGNPAYDISGTVTVTSDNAEEVYVNGELVGSDGEVKDPWNDDYEWGTIKSYPFTASSNPTFDFIVRNYPGSSDPYSNPTGLIFKIEMLYSCPVEVQIDIKPGSDPSCFNNDGNGVIPAAILGSDTFDVYNVNVATVSMEGLTVAMKGKADKYLASYEDVNYDGYLDLVVKIEDVDGKFTKGSGFAKITGNLNDGTPFFGVGDICVTQ